MASLTEKLPKISAGESSEESHEDVNPQRNAQRLMSWWKMYEAIPRNIGEK